jgi:hypothetical protein
MTLDNLFTNRQANASPGEFTTGMQSLKNDENALSKLWVHANPLIPDRKNPISLLSLRRNVDARWVFATKLQGVAQQILQDLSELGPVGTHRR